MTAPLHHFSGSPLISSGAVAYFIYAVLIACIVGFAYSVISAEHAQRRRQPRLSMARTCPEPTRVLVHRQPFDWDAGRPFDWERDL